MAATWQRLATRRARRDRRQPVRVEPGGFRRRRTRTAPRRRSTTSSAARAPRGRTALSARSAPATRSCSRRPPRAHVQGRPGGLDYLVFGTRIRRVRLAAALERGAVELAVGRGAHRRPLGHRGSRSASSSSPSRRAPAERRRPRGRAAGRGRRPVLGEARRLRAFRAELDPAAPRAARLVPHCHSIESEAFVVLDGSGTLELWPTATTPRAAPRSSPRACARATSSRGRRRRASPTRSCRPDGITISRTAPGSRTTSVTTGSNKSTSAASG
jgi:hypothetical protein